MKLLRSVSVITLLTLLATLSLAQDQGWPRTKSAPTGTIVLYQPQVDDWQNYTTLHWRQAFQLTPTGGKMVIGAATFTGHTYVDNDSHIVTIDGITINNTYFSSLDPAASASMAQLVKTFVPPSVDISLDRVVASMPKSNEPVKTVELNNNPPFIFVAYGPAILLAVDGQPVLADIKKTKFKYVVNTQWPLFQDTKDSKYYLLVNQRWLSASDLHGPWSAVTKLPRDFDKIPASDPQFSKLQPVIPPPAATGPIPKVFYSSVPAEVILFGGQPAWANIPQTELAYASNTDSPVFLYLPTQTYYYLAAGRWFSSPNLEGNGWIFASMSLPADFAKIPLSSPASAILASVPGTEEAKDAVLIAQIPTVMEINPTTAAQQAKVTYVGEPQFSPIQGTSMSYATNTPDKVIEVDNSYYLCLQGVWFVSSNAQGPWTTATSVPQVIYTIPPSSPVYNVTYVTQTVAPSGNVQASYTAGYLGAFVTGAAVGAIVASGTGYYYPPYVGFPTYGYPAYYPCATPYGAYGYSNYYNTHTGAYGVSQTAYGAYGSATRTASYNPYTGTYAQSGHVQTPYGGQTVGQAYNPYTGTYGATHQGSSPTAQWGQSYVQNGNKSAYTQHYTTANGTVASAQGSQGGRAYGTTAGAGNTAVGKTSGGDMYAGHDGNVYQNNGSGWQKYNNSSNSWQNVNTQQAQQEAHQQAQNYQQQHPQQTQNYQQHAQSGSQERPSGSSGWSSQNLDQERQNRMSGASQSDRWNRGGGSGSGGSWGGGHSWGGYGGGGRSWGGGGRGGGFRR